jgi:hypothetical protein
MEKKCTCKEPPAPEMADHHEIGCDLVPDLLGWNYYFFDSDREISAVFVNPRDPNAICLRVGERYVVIAREVYDDDDDGAEPVKTTPSSQLVEAHKAVGEACDHLAKADSAGGMGDAEAGRIFRTIGRSLASARDGITALQKLMARDAMRAERKSETV